MLATVAPALLTVAAIIITITLSLRSRAELWIAASVCLSVLAAPIAEEHHFASLGVPMVLMWQARARRTILTSEWLVLGLLAILLMVPLDYTAFRFSRGWTALAAYPRLYAAWLLWAIAIREMYSDNIRGSLVA